ncbi:hypothetical protein RRG08_040871 [Elysia crispata]|uniref:Uncharacterized protein n=1 Tax=Elysia crispata TaxID=231223 RepID=A0AAE1B1J4_9GAST|nr:hypothetical protein RRG08_040871 [Elysia crispata]
MNRQRVPAMLYSLISLYKNSSPFLCCTSCVRPHYSILPRAGVPNSCCCPLLAMMAVQCTYTYGSHSGRAPPARSSPASQVDVSRGIRGIHQGLTNLSQLTSQLFATVAKRGAPIRINH